MSTPLKSLSTFLSPRVASPLSPLSPKLLSVPRKYTNFVKTAKPFGTKERTSAAKRLEFSQHTSPKYFSTSPVRVKVTDYTVNDVTSDIVINTPNKTSIFEKGIEENHGHTILGVGSFGKVVRGIYQGKTVAVKVVKNAFPLSLRERNAVNLSHINIVKTLDIIQNQEATYSLVIMEYFQNSRQLNTLLKDHHFHMDMEIIHFSVDICNGLDFMHRKGILHLDIKPQNILVVDNICKLCDFGNSVLVSDTKNFNHQGTALYTAPELLHGKTPTRKCDIYSFGILLWQLRSRCTPYFEIDNVETVIYKVVKLKWRPENVVPKDDYSKLYHACWDADPDNRPYTGDITIKLKQMF